MWVWVWVWVRVRLSALRPPRFRLALAILHLATAQLVLRSSDAKMCISLPSLLTGPFPLHRPAPYFTYSRSRVEYRRIYSSTGENRCSISHYSPRLPYPTTIPPPHHPDCQYHPQITTPTHPRFNLPHR